VIPLETRLTRQLGPEDAGALFSFLDRHLESSLFLVCNVETAGLVDEGHPLQGTYVAAFEDGVMTAIAAHYRNGLVIMQGDAGLEDAAQGAVQKSGRPVGGLIGPLPLVDRTRRALGMEGRTTRKNDPEVLYALSLDRLRAPPLLAQRGISCRPPTAAEVTDFLVDWRVDYAVEALGAQRTPALRAETRDFMAHASPPGWVLFDGDRPASFSTFNAQARGVVQVGGVFTPPELRGRGYARAVVAASLVEARARGATRSVLFTGVANVAAQRAYAALGYEQVGSFGMVFFA
jgi:ribosomal protein S18 acetylase RimI-like enzyme